MGGSVNFVCSVYGRFCESFVIGSFVMGSFVLVVPLLTQ